MNSGFLMNQFQGNVRPVRPKRADHPPVWEKQCTIGEKALDYGKVYTAIRVYVREPTLEWPEAGLFFSANNGKGYTYSKVTVEDLAKLITMLQEALAEAPGILGDQSKLSDMIKAQQAQIDLIKAQLAQQGQSSESL